MPAIDVYYEMATRRLDAQMEQIDLFDAKTATLFAASSGILAIFAGLLALATLPANQTIRIVVLVALALACVVYVFLLYFLFRAYEVGDWGRNPRMDELASYYLLADDGEMKQWVAKACIDSIEENTPKVERKANYVNWALRMFPAEALLLVLAGIVTLLAK